MKRDFEREDYDTQIKIKAEKTVQSTFVRFPGLLFELALSPHRQQTISIKVEIDTNPPPGAGLATSIIRKHFIFNVLHYDKASLFAGKLHALLTRRYIKGRDIFDLIWSLADKSWPEPNIAFLYCFRWKMPIFSKHNYLCRKRLNVALPGAFYPIGYKQCSATNR